MHRTTARLRADPASRLAALERQRPEWRAWLRLLAEVRAELDDPAWAEPLGGADGIVATGSAAEEMPLEEMPLEEMPLLEGRTLLVDPARLQRLLRRLARAAADGNSPDTAALRHYRPSATEATRLVEETAGQHPSATGLAIVAELAALPLFRACERLLRNLMPTWWPHGHCPICGGWPILAELRGLDRTRRLRCGRCAGDWEVPWMCCAYCGEKDHGQLGALVPGNQGEELLRVEICARCGQYLKSIATLQATPSFELLLRDLETVELDLVALDRGYSRPAGRGIPLTLRVTARPSRPMPRFLRHG
jgi:FdhE protein